MRQVLAKYCFVSTIIMFVCLVAMAVVMNSLVVTRYAFSYSPSWTEEVTRYLMVWMIMLGAATLVLFDDHITLYIVVEKLGPRGRLVHGILVRLVIFVVAALTAQTGYKFSFSMWNILAPGSSLPMTVPTLAVPVSMTLIAIFSAYLIYRDVLKLLGRGVGPMLSQSTFMDGSFRPPESE